MDNGKKKMKKKSKLAVDILMTLTLLFLMGYQLWGEQLMSGQELSCLCSFSPTTC